MGLRFLGVGNAQARELGTSAAVLEIDGEPAMLIDCGEATLDAYGAHYGGLPEALFLTHCHFDHIGGLEGLFYDVTTGPTPVKAPKIFTPVSILPLLQRRVADYPNPLAEGGVNFWDGFHLIPVSERFWFRNMLFDVFPARHHEPGSAFGIALPGSFLFSGDTRPIPEQISRHGSRGEVLFHDCALQSNPSHSGLDDLAREYKDEQLRRFVLYHYESEGAGRTLKDAGFRIARPGERFELGRRRRNATADHLSLAEVRAGASEPAS